MADAGYLTLNPLRYTHPVLSIVLPVFFLLLGGLGLPGGAVYIRPAALRSRRWEALTAAAGPLGTLAFTLAIVWPFFLPDALFANLVTERNYYFWPALAVLGLLQVSALVFNLLPIPSLDGFAILAPSLPEAARQYANQLGSRLFLLLMLMMWRVEPVGDAFWGAVIDGAVLLRIPLDLAFEGMGQYLWWQAWS